MWQTAQGLPEVKIDLIGQTAGLIETRSKQWQQARTSLEVTAQLNPPAEEVQNASGQEALGEGDTRRTMEITSLSRTAYAGMQFRRSARTDILVLEWKVSFA
jgi:hypothetical protein